MIILLLAGIALGAPAEVSLGEAVRMAQGRNVEARVAELEVDAARARAHQVRSYYLPSLSASYNAVWWDSALEAVFFDENPCEGVDEIYQGICNDLIGGMLEDPILLREAHTRQAKVQATQPLTGLYAISQGHRAARQLVLSSEAQLQATRSRVSLDVVDTWLQAAKTAHLAQVAADGVQTIEAHERRVTAFQEQGLVGKNEVLQLQVALGDARLDLRRANMGVELLQRKLALVTNAEADQLVPEPLDIQELPPLDLDSGDLEALAQAKPEVLALEAQAAAALANRNRARAMMIPQVGAVAQWTRNWGVGSMAAEQEAMVGLGLEWEVWAWGRRHFEAREANLQAQQARVGLQGLQEGAQLQAQAALLDAQIAAEAWESSELGREQAEENLRIVTARYEAHTLATTDLLEAETMAAKARADHIGAGYDYLIALARLQDALGLPIDPLAGVRR